MWLFKICILTILLVPGAARMAHARAGSGLLKHYGTEDGLASNHVYCMLQDRQGYLWFATNNGVSRFDGKVFESYTAAQGLPDNEVVNVWEDAVGRIWLNSFNGRPCYIRDGRVYTAADDTTLKQLQNLNYFYACRFGDRLVITNSGAKPNVEIARNGSIRPISLHGNYDVFRNNLLSCGALRLGRLYLVDRAYRKTDSLFFPGVMQGRSVLSGIYVLGPDRFAVSFGNGTAIRYTIAGNRIHLLDSVRGVQPLIHTYYHQGRLWADLQGTGVIPVNESLQADSSRDVLFRGRTISYFFVDREGNYWATTPGEGVFLVPHNGFRYYTREHGLYENNILALAQWENELYLGFNNMVVQGLHDLRLYHTAQYNNAGFLEKITSMCADSGYIVVGGSGKLTVIQKKSHRHTRLNLANVKSVHHGTGDTVLLSTHSRSFAVALPDRLTDTIGAGRTTAICSRKNGDVLVGTLHGLQTYRRNARRQWIADTLSYPATLQQTTVSCIEEMGAVIVVGTNQRGLILINGRDVERVKLDAGRDNVNCRKIVVDGRDIWLASNSGIYKIETGPDIHTYTAHRVSKFNGLLSDYVSDLAVLGDEVYAAGAEGLSVFPKDLWQQLRTAPPAVYINELLAGGRPQPRDGPMIRLPANAGNIRFRFSAIDFKSLGNIVFRYRLVGLNDHWQYTRENMVRYESLPPGTYRFELMAMNAHEVWSDGPVLLSFTIAPPWWQAGWFRLLLLLSGIALVYGAVRWYLTRKHKAEIRETAFRRQLAEIELKAIKAQINPHFLFNTLNAIQYFIANKENEQAEAYLTRMAGLLRRTLDCSSKTVVPVADEIAYLENYLELEKLRFDDRFSYTITNQLPPGMGLVQVPPMVLQPHIENALRHGLKQKKEGTKRLDICFSLAGNSLVCEVEDNGIGRSAAMNRKGSAYDHLSIGMDLSGSKLMMYEQLSGKKVRTEIIDKYVKHTTIADGTLVRITINL